MEVDSQTQQVDITVLITRLVAEQLIPASTLEILPHFRQRNNVVQTWPKLPLMQGFENLNFQSIMVEAIVDVNLEPGPEVHQDLFHISSPLHDASSWKSGIEVGLRRGYWVIGVNFGLGLNRAGYMECKGLKTYATTGRHRVVFHKFGSIATLIVDGEELILDVGQQDLNSEWLNPTLVIGGRKDTHDQHPDFLWRGGIPVIFAAPCYVPPHVPGRASCFDSSMTRLFMHRYHARLYFRTLQQMHWHLLVAVNNSQTSSRAVSLVHSVGSV